MCRVFVTMHILTVFALVIMPNGFVLNILLGFFYAVNFT